MPKSKAFPPPTYCAKFWRRSPFRVDRKPDAAVRQPRLWLTVWVTPRFLYALGGIALVLACAPGLPALLPLAIVLAIALVAGVVVDAALGPRAPDVRVERLPAEHLALRVALDVSYRIENRSSRPLRVGIIETPVRTLQWPEDDATTGVPAHSSVRLMQTVTPVARGSDAFGALYVWIENAVGLLRRRTIVDERQPFRVFPDLSAVERYGSLHLRNRTIEAGLRKLRLRGTGTEFESLREYSEGDAFRFIDWHATARRGKLMVAHHEVERSQNVMLVLDCGRLMTPRIGGKLRKFDYAVTAALSVAAIAGLASDRVGVVAFAREILAASAPRSTRSSIARITEQLYDIEPRFEESDYARAFVYLRSHLHKRSLVLFLTDVIDPISQSALLAELASVARHHLLVCVFMNDDAVNAALSTAPHDVAGAFRAGVAVGLAEERRTAAALLTRMGILVIDVPAEKLTTSLIDEYLRVKQRGLL
jgi:uncharacterized protein (DUF58 family)